MQFGVNTWIWVAPLSDADLEWLVPHLAKNGADMVELSVEGLHDYDYAKAGQLIKEHGLGVDVVAAMGPDRDLIHAGDLGDDASDSGDGLTLGIDDRKRGKPFRLQAIQGIGSDRRAFTRRKDQHFPADGLAFQLVTPLEDQTTFRIDAAIKRNPLRCDQGLALDDPGIDFSALKHHDGSVMPSTLPRQYLRMSGKAS